MSNIFELAEDIDKAYEALNNTALDFAVAYHTNANNIELAEASEAYKNARDELDRAKEAFIERVERK